MKKFKAPFILFLALSLLAGCRGNTIDTSYGADSAGEPESHVSSSSPVSEPEASSDISISSTTSKTFTKAEAEQIVACFKEWSYLDYGLHPDAHTGYFPECLDESQFITDEVSPKGSVRVYTEEFYKVVSGDYATEDGFNKALKKMFTEKFKERYMGSSSGAMLRFKDGETYVQGFGYGAYPDWVLNLDIYIDNFDGNSVEVTLARDTYDEVERCSAVLVKGEDGNYRMDNGDLFDIPDLFHCKSANITVYQNDNVLFTL